MDTGLSNSMPNKTYADFCTNIYHIIKDDTNHDQQIQNMLFKMTLIPRLQISSFCASITALYCFSNLILSWLFQKQHGPTIARQTLAANFSHCILLLTTECKIPLACLSRTKSHTPKDFDAQTESFVVAAIRFGFRE